MNAWNVTLKLPAGVLNDYRQCMFNRIIVAALTNRNYPLTIFLGSIYGLNPTKVMVPLASHETLHAVLNDLGEYDASMALDKLRLHGHRGAPGLGPGTATLGTDGLWDPELQPMPIMNFVLDNAIRRDVRLQPKPVTLVLPRDPASPIHSDRAPF